jgi:sulfite exporter TauE/SafE
MGRILTYGLLGSLVSFVGMGLSFAGIQDYISIIAGVIVLIIAVANLRIAAPLFINRVIGKLILYIKTKFKLSPILLGMVNGLLPCGLTLVALGYCITLDWPADGFLAMIYFGLGTLPAMLGIPTVMKSLVGRLRIGYKPIHLTLMIVSGILLIGRGLSNGDMTTHLKIEKGIIECGNNP